MPTTSGYRVSIGKQAHTWSCLADGVNATPNNSHEIITPVTWARAPSRNSFRPPAATLFIVIIERMVTAMSGLNWNVAVQNPPNSESYRSEEHTSELQSLRH